MIASTHNKEEKLIIPQLKIISKKYPLAKFFISPRHPHRSEIIYNLLKFKGLDVGYDLHNLLFAQLCFIGRHNRVKAGDNLGQRLQNGLADVRIIHGDGSPVLQGDAFAVNAAQARS